MPMTLMLVIAAYAVGLYRLGTASSAAAPTAGPTAWRGVPVRACTRRHRPDPGSAPSRLHANTIRDAAAVSALPQNSWATITTSSSAFAPAGPRASRKICAGGTPVAVARVAP